MAKSAKAGSGRGVLKLLAKKSSAAMQIPNSAIDSDGQALAFSRQAAGAWADVMARWPQLGIERAPSFSFEPAGDERIRKIWEAEGDLLCINGRLFALSMDNNQIKFAYSIKEEIRLADIRRAVSQAAFFVSSSASHPAGEGFFNPDIVPSLFSKALDRPVEEISIASDKEWMAGAIAYTMGEEEFVRAYAKGDEYSMVHAIDMAFGAGTYFAVSSAWIRGENPLHAFGKKITNHINGDDWFDGFSDFMRSLGWDVKETLVPYDSHGSVWKPAYGLLGSERNPSSVF